MKDKKILKLLKNFLPDTKFFIVGGAVRDMLQDKTPKDIDVVVYTTPDVLLAKGCVFADAKTCIPVFIADIDGVKVELALPRTEIKSGNGHRGFQFIHSTDIPIEKDLARRDFTVNAMAMDRDGNIIDPFNGLADLQNHVLKAVSETTFFEDPVRILRMARFAAKGFNVDQSTLKVANKVSVDDMKAVPVERFTNEFLKALEEKQFDRFIQTIFNVPVVVDVFLAQIKDIVNVPAGPVDKHPEGTVLNHILQTIQKTKTAEANFMAFVHDLGKVLTPKDMLPKHIGHDNDRAVQFVVKLVADLRFTRRHKKLAELAVAFHMLPRQNIKHSTAIRIADELVKANAVEPFIELIKADGTPDDKVQFLLDAVDVVKVKVTDLVQNIATVKDKAQAIMQARVLRLQKLQQARA